MPRRTFSSSFAPMRGSVRSFWSLQSCSSSSIGAHLEMFEQQRDALRAQALDLQKLERGGRKFQQQFIAPVAAAALFRSRPGRQRGLCRCPGTSVIFALRIGEDIGDAFGIAFDGGGAVAIAADAEAVVAGDLHQIGGFIENARIVAIFQAFQFNAGGAKAMLSGAFEIDADRLSICDLLRRSRRRCSRPALAR